MNTKNTSKIGLLMLTLFSALAWLGQAQAQVQNQSLPSANQESRLPPPPPPLIGQARQGGPETRDDPAQFAKIKSKIVEIKQNQLNGMQSSLKCTQAAQNREALHVCHDQDRKEHDKMREQIEKMKK